MNYEEYLVRYRARLVESGYCKADEADRFGAPLESDLPADPQPEADAERFVAVCIDRLTARNERLWSFAKHVQHAIRQGAVMDDGDILFNDVVEIVARALALDMWLNNPDDDAMMFDWLRTAYDANVQRLRASQPRHRAG